MAASSGAGLCGAEGAGSTDGARVLLPVLSTLGERAVRVMHGVRAVRSLVRRRRFLHRYLARRVDDSLVRVAGAALEAVAVAVVVAVQGHAVVAVVVAVVAVLAMAMAMVLVLILVLLILLKRMRGRLVLGRGGLCRRRGCRRG